MSEMECWCEDRWDLTGVCPCTTEHVEEVTDPDTGIVYVPGEGRI